MPSESQSSLLPHNRWMAKSGLHVNSWAFDQKIWIGMHWMANTFYSYYPHCFFPWNQLTARQKLQLSWTIQTMTISALTLVNIAAQIKNKIILFDFHEERLELKRTWEKRNCFLITFTFALFLAFFIPYLLIFFPSTHLIESKRLALTCLRLFSYKQGNKKCCIYFQWVFR